VDGFGDPLRTAGAASYFAWLTGRGPDSHLTRLWDSVWASRPDLQQVFPDARGAGAPALRAWARAFGLAEYGLSAVWLDEEPA
jgi:hypothetical protein